MQRNKLIPLGILIGLLCIGGIGYGIYTLVSRMGKEAVEVSVIPENATLTVNGQKIGNGTQYLVPGSYEVEAKKEGFTDYKKSVTIGKPNTESIDIALEAVSEEAKKWAQDNNRKYLEREGRVGEHSRERGTEFKRLNPITNNLPVSNILYSIGYTLDPADASGNSIILQVTAMEGYREAILIKIRELGYDPTNFKINFKQYESPFDK